MIRLIKKKRELLKLNEFLDSLSEKRYSTRDISYNLLHINVLYIDYQAYTFLIKKSLLDVTDIDNDDIIIMLKSKYHVENYKVIIV